MFDDTFSYLKDFLMYMETIKNRSSNTIKEYYYDLRLAFKFIKKDKLNLSENLNSIIITDINLKFLKEINVSDLYKYINFLLKEFNDKPVTRSRKISSLKSFFNYLCFKEKLLILNPASELESPKLPKRLPKYLSLDESVALLHSVDITQEKFGSRDFCILTIFLNCGLRLSELININLKDIKDNNLSVIGKGNKERNIHLNATCMVSINNYLKVRPNNNLKDRDALFISNKNNRISRRMVELIVKKYILLSGLDPKKYSPHKLRHTAATLMHKHR